MAISTVKNYWGRTGSVDAESRIKKYVRVFEVITDNIYDDGDTIVVHEDIPKLFDSHPNATGAKVVSLSAAQEAENPKRWFVTVNYSTKVPPEIEEDPLARKPRISMRSSNKLEVATNDADGNVIVNTALDSPVPAFERTVSNWVFHVEKNYPVDKLPGWMIDGYDNAINKDTFTIRGLKIPKETSRLTNLQASDEKKENDVEFVTVSFDIEFQSKGYVREWFSRGFNERYQLTLNKLDDDGNLIPTPGGEDFESETVWRKRKILINGEVPSDAQFLDEFGTLIEQPSVEDSDDAKQQFLDSLYIIKTDIEAKKPFKVLPLK